MLCPHCNKRETKTPKFTYCNACYVSYYRKQRPGYAQYGINGYKALLRDNFQCQNCFSKPIKGNRKNRLDLHHIDGKGSATPTKERNNSLDNLITLCKKCHIEIEKKRHWTGKWATDYECCVNCQKTTVKHSSLGFCTRCYAKLQRLRAKVKIQLMRIFAAL
jgi:hypothetical protein